MAYLQRELRRVNRAFVRGHGSVPAIRRVLLDYPRLHTEWFPKYAPELYPAEQVSRAIRPTACGWRSKISETVFMPANAGYGVLRTSCDLSFWHPNCRHRWDRVHLRYSCETQ